MGSARGEGTQESSPSQGKAWPAEATTGHVWPERHFTGQGTCSLQNMGLRQSPMAWNCRLNSYLLLSPSQEGARSRERPHVVPAWSQNWSYWENSILEEAGG